MAAVVAIGAVLGLLALLSSSAREPPKYVVEGQIDPGVLASTTQDGGLGFDNWSPLNPLTAAASLWLPLAFAQTVDEAAAWIARSIEQDPWLSKLVAETRIRAISEPAQAWIVLAEVPRKSGGFTAALPIAAYLDHEQAAATLAQLQADKPFWRPRIERGWWPADSSTHGAE